MNYDLKFDDKKYTIETKGARSGKTENHDECTAIAP